MKAANISVQHIRTSLGTGQCKSLATYHATMQSEQINSLAIVYTTLAHKVSLQPMNLHTMRDWVMLFWV